jgi:hypothetical protein
MYCANKVTFLFINSPLKGNLFFRTVDEIGCELNLLLTLFGTILLLGGLTASFCNGKWATPITWGLDFVVHDGLKLWPFGDSRIVRIHWLMTSWRFSIRCPWYILHRVNKTRESWKVALSILLHHSCGGLSLLECSLWRTLGFCDLDQNPRLEARAKFYTHSRIFKTLTIHRETQCSYIY